MRKRLMILALVLIAVLMTCTLAACSGSDGRCSGGHTWDEGTVKEAATCLESGTLINKCTVCGIKREVAIEALGHDLQTIPGTVVEPTCEVDGYAGKKACVREGCEYVLDTGTIIPAIGHAYGDWTSNGDGTHKRVCSNDSNHVESGNCSGGTADCGHKAVCDVCGGEYGDFASSHVFDKQVTTDAYKATDATCEAKATYYFSCDCGKAGTETFEYGDYADHVFDREEAEAEYLVSVATCTSPAIYNKSCACGHEGTETFEYGVALPHTFDNEVASDDYKATDATCTKPATYYYSCDCGAHGTATFAYGDMLAHVYDKELAGDKYLASVATCEKKATYYKSCYCGHFDVDVSATFESGELGDHVYDNKVVNETYKATDATCTKKATYYLSCDCGKAGTETFESGETLPHVYDKEVTEDKKYLKFAANCASAAVYYKSCACGHFDTETSPTFYFGAPSGNHVYDREVATDDYKATDATCIAKATYYYSCECGEKGTTTFESGATLDHTMNYHAAVDATCVSKGNVEYWTCSTCSLDYDSATGGNVIDDVKTAIDSTNHVHTTISKLASEPSCKAEGFTAEIFCEDCKTVIQEREVIPALGHDMGDWFVSHEPTCTVTGVNERTCKRDDCDYFETEAIPTIAHSVTTLHPEVPATCIQKGTREYYECENCDKYVVNDGEFKTSWGDIVIKVDATNHVHTEKLDGKAATCTETGLTVGEKCTDCGATIKEQEEIPALGHTGGAAVKENVVAATCTVAGSYDSVVYCSVCDAEVSRTEVTEDATGHIISESVANTCSATGCGYVISAEEIFARIADLDSGKTLIGLYQLTGVVRTIETEYSSEYKNISVVIQVGDVGSILCFRMIATSADDVIIGDTITVTGNITNHHNAYDGSDTIEFAAKCAFTMVAKAKYSLTFDTIENCEILGITNGATFSRGETINFKVVADKGYAVQGVKANGVDCNKSGDDFSFVITADTTLTFDVVTKENQKSEKAFATFDFGENGTATHTDGSEIKEDTKFESGEYTLNLTALTKVYGGARDAKGTSALKLGTTDVQGQFTITNIPEEATIVYLYVANYKSNTTTISVNGKKYEIAGKSNDGEYDIIKVDTSTQKTIEFVTGISGDKRCMIDKIEYVKMVQVCDSCVAGDAKGSDGNKHWDICVNCGSDFNHNAHTMTRIEAKDPTCVDAGNKEYWSCEQCGKFFDAEISGNVFNGTDEFVLVALPTAHNYVNGTCTHCGKTEPAAGQDITESLKVVGTTGTLTEDKLSISWYSAGFTFTNNKTNNSNAIRTSDSDHYRIYANSEIVVTATAGNISVIKFTCTSNSYASALATSIGGTATVDGSIVTVALESSTFTTTITAQVRISNVEVTYVASIGGEEEHKHSYDNEVADAKYLATPATCIAKATYYKSCSCKQFDKEKSETFEYGEIDEDAHDWDEGVVTAPTCTADGYTTYTCKNNAEHKKVVTKENSKLDHTYDQNNADAEFLATPATCVAKATYYKSCSCGHFDAEKSTTFEYGEIAVDEHDWDEGVVSAPTCTADGYTTYTCKNNAEHKKVVTEENSKLDHIYDQNNADAKYLATPATCSAKATYYKSCACGHFDAEKSTTFEYGEIDADNHDWDKGVYTEPTCTADGYTTYTCKNNAEHKNVVTKENSKLDHSWVETSRTEATCVATGAINFVCEHDNSHTKTETIGINANAHDLVKRDAKAPTCTEIGWDAYEECSRCDYTTYVEKSALGHNKVEHEAKAPTCEEIGWDAYVTCSRCDYTTYVEKEAAGHKYESAVTDPTCVADGYTTYTCFVCKHSYTAETTNRLGHAFGEWTETEAPTCTEKGESRRDCDRCDYFEIEEISAAGHKYESVVTAPTCEADGYTTYICSVCKHSYTADTTNKLGHEDKDSNNVCDTCKDSLCEEHTSNKWESDETNHWHICTACGFRFGEVAHTAGELVVENEKDATCTTAGSYDNVVYCTVCNAELSRETITVEATDHDYQAVLIAPTCTTDGYTTHTCSKCKDSYVDTPVEALDHDLVTAYEVVVVEEVNILHKVTKCVREGCEHIAEDVTVDTTNSVAVANETDLRTVLENGFKAQLTENVDLVKGSIDLVGVSATLDLNGHNISVVGPKYAETTDKYVCGVFYLDGATLTIDGEGELFASVDSADSIYVISAINGSKVTLNGGTYRSSGCTTIFGRTNTTITINGGTYIAEVEWDGLYFTLDILESELKGGTNATINVYGGTFHNFDPANHTNDGTYTNKVMDGHHSIKDDDNYVVSKHTEETIPAVDATCTATGLTEGKKCSVCGEILVAQEEVALKDHTAEVVAGKPATCTETGLKDGSKCSVCGKVLVEQEVINALGHNFVAGEVVAPKCEAQGYTIYDCSRCDATENRNYVAATGHTEVVDAAVAPTCTATGLTEGKHCSVCEKVLLAQEEVAIVGDAHKYGDWTSNGDDTHSRVCEYNGEHKETEYCSGGTATTTQKAICDVCKSEYGNLVEKVEPYEHSYTLDKSDFAADTTSKNVGGHTWTYSGCTYFGWDTNSSKGFQFGSSNDPSQDFIFVSDEFKQVTKIVINTSGASKSAIKLVVSVGDRVIYTIDELGTSAQAYEIILDVALTGAIKFHYTQSTSKALYIKSITVYGPQCQHEDAEHYNLLEATCVTAGKAEHYICSCGKVLDANKVETTEDKLTITALGHDYPTTWTSDEAGNHTHTCGRDGCDEVETEACTLEIRSTDEKYWISDATCIDPSKYYMSCECGYYVKSDEYIFDLDDATGHTEPNLEGRCDSCNISLCTEHTPVATYDETHHWTYCEDCSEIIDEKVEHEFGSETTNDEDKNQHYTTCSCGKKNYYNHIYAYTTTDTSHTGTCACGDTFSGDHSFGDDNKCVCGKTQEVEHTATLSFASTAQRTTWDTSQQVWEQNGIVLTNNKGSSTSDVADHADPARFYKYSTISVEAPGKITTIVFHCNTAAYATALQSSIGDSATVSGKVVTYEVNSAELETITFTLSGGQVRMDSIEVTYMG